MDLIKEVAELLNIENNGQESTCVQVDHKLKSRDRVGKEHGLSGSTVSRYLRLNELIPAHKRRLDSGAISMMAAVNLSYLSSEEMSNNLVDTIRLKTDKGCGKVGAIREIHILQTL